MKLLAIVGASSLVLLSFLALGVFLGAKMQKRMWELRISDPNWWYYGENICRLPPIIAKIALKRLEKVNGRGT